MVRSIPKIKGRYYCKTLKKWTYQVPGLKKIHYRRWVAIAHGDYPWEIQ